MTSAQSTEALRREALVLELRALMAHGHSFNGAQRLLGEPVASLHRYHKAYDGTLESLAPKQPGNSGAKSVRERFVAALGEDAVVRCEKKVAALSLDMDPSIDGTSRPLSDGLAWRTFARSAECPQPIRDYFAEGQRRSKHTIAASIRQASRPGPLAAAKHRGPRTYGLRGPYQPRRLDILPGDIFSSDDTTPIWGWWVPWPKSDKYPYGVKLLQGQFLPVIDVASQLILTYALIAREQSSYRAADIWRLMGRVHSTVGLPRLGWQKERGSWEAQIIDGVLADCPVGEAASFPRPGKPTASPTDEPHGPTHAQRVGGLRMLPSNLTPYHRGILGEEKSAAFTRLRTWTSYLPKSKSVEGIFHRLQKFEGTLFGCLGRSQQRRPFEKTKKIYEACRAGKADPRLHFMSGTALMEKLNACIGALEAECIEGEVFHGKPRETWARGLAEHGPLLAEPPEGKWLMTSDWSLVTARQGMARIRRVDEVTGLPVSYFYAHPDFCTSLDGRSVLIYFNRDAFEEPAHVLLPGASGNHEYVGQAGYVERTGMFLDGDVGGYELRKRQSGLVTTLYSDLAANLPSRQLPADLAVRRASYAVETRHPGGDFTSASTAGASPSSPDRGHADQGEPGSGFLEGSRMKHPGRAGRPFDEDAELARIAQLERLDADTFAVP